MFQFAGFPSAAYMPSRGCTGSARAGSPIQAPADHSAFATPRSFSQLIAPFIGPQCQGIRPAPYFCLAPAFRTPSVACFRLFISAFRCHPWAPAPCAHAQGVLCFGIRFSRYGCGAVMPAPMGLSGLEPPTSRLSGVRSNRLSYKPRLAPQPHGCFFIILLLFPAAACFPMPSPA